MPRLFQSTRPHGARRGMIHHIRQRLKCFNPRARMGRDSGCFPSCSPKIKFQSTRPHGARLMLKAQIITLIRFNPRARMGRDTIDHEDLTEPISFNPRARMGRDNIKLGENIMAQVVSIHAPAWGATKSKMKSIIMFMFQSTRPHGARRMYGAAWGAAVMFQSTRPHGARRVIKACFISSDIVSIHAPAWGATATSAIVSTKLASFNPRARMGRDIANNKPFPIAPRFNPRARMGRDFRFCPNTKTQSLVSIHAPAWGATL